MTDIQKKQIFIELRDYFKSKNLKWEDAYDRLNNDLRRTNSLDYDYGNTLNTEKAKNYLDVVKGYENFSFKKCCSLLTFFLRGEHFAEGFFKMVLDDGYVYKVLVQACKVM